MTDKEILDIFHAGNRENAFNELVKKYQEKIYWHIRRIVIEHPSADDVMQNTFIKVWRSLENFRAESQLFTWIYRIATNECLNYLNIEKKHGHISFETNDSDEEESYSPSNYVKADTPLQDADKLQERLKAAIEALPEKQRIVFNLRYYDEMPYEQMSQVLETSVGALKASYHHAAQKIEKFLLQGL